MLALGEPQFRAVIGRLACVPPPHRAPWFAAVADRLVELDLVTVEDVEAASGPEPVAPVDRFPNAGRPASSGLARALDLPRVPRDTRWPRKTHRRASRSRDGPVKSEGKGTVGFDAAGRETRGRVRSARGAPIAARSQNSTSKAPEGRTGRSKALWTNS